MPSSVINSDDGVISGTSGLKSVGGDDGVLVFQSKGTETARINTDKQIVAAAGTASLPIYSTTGDLNTGIFFPAADTIAFAEGGAEAMRIDSSGRVGIGTTSPSTILHIKGSGAGLTIEGTLGTGSTHIIEASGTNNANLALRAASSMFFTANSADRMVIDSSGNVGIGTTSPGQKLVVSGAGAQRFDIIDTGGATGRISTSSGTVFIGTTTNSPVALFTNDAERMRIDSSGNVGIGTTSPTASKLVVSEAAGSGTLRTILTLRTAESSTGTGGSLDFTQETTIVGRVSSIFEGAGQLGMAFSTFNNALNERMRISAGGTITFNAYGAGTLSTSASGVISASDGRYKTKTRQIDNALSVIQSLQPTYFRWHEDSPFASEYEELGFVAQEVAEVIPEASPGEDEEEKYRNYHDRAIIAMLVKGVQELKAELDTVKAELATLKGN